MVGPEMVPPGRIDDALIGLPDAAAAVPHRLDRQGRSRDETPAETRLARKRSSSPTVMTGSAIRPPDHDCAAVAVPSRPCIARWRIQCIWPNRKPDGSRPCPNLQPPVHLPVQRPVPCSCARTTGRHRRAHAQPAGDAQHAFRGDAGGAYARIHAIAADRFGARRGTGREGAGVLRRPRSQGDERAAHRSRIAAAAISSTSCRPAAP